MVLVILVRVLDMAVAVLVGTDAPFRGSYQELILQQRHNLCSVRAAHTQLLLALVARLVVVVQLPGRADQA